MLDEYIRGVAARPTPPTPSPFIDSGSAQLRMNGRDGKKGTKAAGKPAGTDGNKGKGKGKTVGSPAQQRRPPQSLHRAKSAGASSSTSTSASTSHAAKPLTESPPRPVSSVVRDVVHTAAAAALGRSVELDSSLFATGSPGGNPIATAVSSGSPSNQIYNHNHNHNNDNNNNDNGNRSNNRSSRSKKRTTLDAAALGNASRGGPRSAEADPPVSRTAWRNSMGPSVRHAPPVRAGKPEDSRGFTGGTRTRSPSPAARRVNNPSTRQPRNTCEVGVQTSSDDDSNGSNGSNDCKDDGDNDGGLGGGKFDGRGSGAVVKRGGRAASYSVDRFLERTGSSSEWNLATSAALTEIHHRVADAIGGLDDATAGTDPDSPAAFHDAVDPSLVMASLYRQLDGCAESIEDRRSVLRELQGWFHAAGADNNSNLSVASNNGTSVMVGPTPRAPVDPTREFAESRRPLTRKLGELHNLIVGARERIIEERAREMVESRLEEQLEMLAPRLRDESEAQVSDLRAEMETMRHVHAREAADLRERATFAEDQLNVAKAEMERVRSEAEMGVAIERQRAETIAEKAAAEAELLSGRVESLTAEIAKMQSDHKIAIADIEVTHASEMRTLMQRHGDALSRLDAELQSQIEQCAATYNEMARKVSSMAHERSKAEVAAISSVLGSHASSVANAIHGIVASHAREFAALAVIMSDGMRGMSKGEISGLAREWARSLSELDAAISRAHSSNSSSAFPESGNDDGIRGVKGVRGVTSSGSITGPSCNANATNSNNGNNAADITATETLGDAHHKELRRLVAELEQEVQKLRAEAAAATVARAAAEQAAEARGKAAASEIREDSRLRVRLTSAPKGLVTLVFTDVQDSTALWDADHDAMVACLEAHDGIMRGMISAHSGYEVKTEGDAFMVAFENTEDAVSWCADVQLALLNYHSWPSGLADVADYFGGAYLDGVMVWHGPKVRMGVHVGKPICKQDRASGRMDYFGPMVNRSARVGGCAHGGQILLSGAAYKAVAPILAEGLRTTQIQGAATSPPPYVRYIGKHALKGLRTDEDIYELYPSQVAARAQILPPIKTLTNAAREASAARRGSNMESATGGGAGGGKVVTTKGGGRKVSVVVDSDSDRDDTDGTDSNDNGAATGTASSPGAGDRDGGAESAGVPRRGGSQAPSHASRSMSKESAMNAAAAKSASRSLSRMESASGIAQRQRSGLGGLTAGVAASRALSRASTVDNMLNVGNIVDNNNGNNISNIAAASRDLSSVLEVRSALPPDMAFASRAQRSSSHAPHGSMMMMRAASDLSTGAVSAAGARFRMSRAMSSSLAQGATRSGSTRSGIFALMEDSDTPDHIGDAGGGSPPNANDGGASASGGFLHPPPSQFAARSQARSPSPSPLHSAPSMNGAAAGEGGEDHSQAAAAAMSSASMMATPLSPTARESLTRVHSIDNRGTLPEEVRTMAALDKLISETQNARVEPMSAQRTDHRDSQGVGAVPDITAAAMWLRDAVTTFAAVLAASADGGPTDSTQQFQIQQQRLTPSEAEPTEAAIAAMAELLGSLGVVVEPGPADAPMHYDDGHGADAHGFLVGGFVGAAGGARHNDSHHHHHHHHHHGQRGYNPRVAARFDPRAPPPVGLSITTGATHVDPSTGKVQGRVGAKPYGGPKGKGSHGSATHSLLQHGLRDRGAALPGIPEEARHCTASDESSVYGSSGEQLPDPNAPSIGADAVQSAVEGVVKRLGGQLDANAREGTKIEPGTAPVSTNGNESNNASPTTPVSSPVAAVKRKSNPGSPAGTPPPAPYPLFPMEQVGPVTFPAARPGGLRTRKAVETKRRLASAGPPTPLPPITPRSSGLSLTPDGGGGGIGNGDET